MKRYVSSEGSRRYSEVAKQEQFKMKKIKLLKVEPQLNYGIEEMKFLRLS